MTLDWLHWSLLILFGLSQAACWCFWSAAHKYRALYLDYRDEADEREE